MIGKYYAYLRRKRSYIAPFRTSGAHSYNTVRRGAVTAMFGRSSILTNPISKQLQCRRNDHHIGRDDIPPGRSIAGKIQEGAVFREIGIQIVDTEEEDCRPAGEIGNNRQLDVYRQVNASFESAGDLSVSDSFDVIHDDRRQGENAEEDKEQCREVQRIDYSYHLPLVFSLLHSMTASVSNYKQCRFIRRFLMAVDGIGHLNTKKMTILQIAQETGRLSQERLSFPGF